jgi:hypothetical protein
VPNNVQTPWSHNDCLAVVRAGANLTSFFASYGLSGTMYTGSGSISGLLNPGCTISQIIVGLLKNQRYYLALSYIRVGAGNLVVSMNGVQIISSNLIAQNSKLSMVSNKHWTQLGNAGNSFMATDSTMTLSMTNSAGLTLLDGLELICEFCSKVYLN